MIALTKQTLIHVVKSRMLLMLLAFSFVVEYYAVRLLKSMTTYFSYSVQGNLHQIQLSETTFAAILVSLGASAFVASIYGGWVVPYAHRGPRGTLTHVLPVSRWAFLGAYGMAYGFIFVLQGACLLVALLVQQGVAQLEVGKVLLTFGAGILPLLTMVFAMAVGALLMGSLSAYILCSVLLFALSAIRAITYFDGAQPMGWMSFLPPVSELPFDIRLVFGGHTFPREHLLLWGVWLLIFVSCLRWRLRRPQGWRGSDT